MRDSHELPSIFLHCSLNSVVLLRGEFITALDSLRHRRKKLCIKREEPHVIDDLGSQSKLFIFRLTVVDRDEPTIKPAIISFQLCLDERYTIFIFCRS